MKLKFLNLAIGIVLAISMGFSQATELDEPAKQATELDEPVEMAGPSCRRGPVTEEESRKPIKFEYGLEYDIGGEALFIRVDGIGLAHVKHFIFNGQIIDDFIYEGRDNGLVTIHDGDQNILEITISLPFIQISQTIVGGVFGIVMSDGTTVSSEIPSDLYLPGQNGRHTRIEPTITVAIIGGAVVFGTAVIDWLSGSKETVCEARYRIRCDGVDIFTPWQERGTVGDWNRCSTKLKRCINKAKTYAEGSLRFDEFNGITKQKYCECFREGNVLVRYEMRMSNTVCDDPSSRNVKSRLNNSCDCPACTLQ